MTVREKATGYRGWIWAENRAGQGGWIPESYLERTGADGALALTDYSSRELAVKPGDPVDMIRVVSGWAEVRTDSGETGWIPEKKLRACEASDRSGISDDSGQPP